MDENKILEERKGKFVDFLKKDLFFSAFFILSIFSLLSGIIGVFPPSIWLVLFICSALSAVFAYFNKKKFAFYPLLGWVVWLAVYIRTLNLPKLRDITTGAWTLGPDLDPFLFLRWAKDIIVHGSLSAYDAMRYVPLGFKTKAELIFLPYLIAWFHKIAALFGSTSVEQSAAIFPVFMFALTVIAFFLLARKIFINSLGKTKSSLIALISCLFLSLIPVFIPRTIAGIPEKESAGFFFLFLAVYLFISAWQAKQIWQRILLAFLAGLTTIAMAMVWGGVIYIYATIALAVFIAFLLGQVDTSRFYVYTTWLASSVLLVQLFTTRYPLKGLIISPATGVAFGVFALILIDFLLYSTALRKYFESESLKKIPKPVVSIIVTLILGILVTSILFGVGFLPGVVRDIMSHIITPSADRLGLTIAENRQPFFNEWAYSFGPTLAGIPLTFWLFFFGSVYLFYKMIHVFSRKEKIIATLSYLAFLVCMVFSRYSSTSILNGTSNTSLFVYALGFIVLLITCGYYFYKYHRAGEDSRLKEIEFGLVLLFAFFFLSIVSARGAVRIIMVLVPPASIIIAYLFVESLAFAKRIKDSAIKLIGWIIIALLVLSTIFAAYHFYQESAATAANYVPSAYNQQWQKAMSWVRTNTPQNSVFAHWWDYGYWVQSIGERATVLDGGNAITYWDHLMGRYALTGSNDSESLEFLYTHNVTHLLIDSSDIGKYPAFSSIGSDENYDRYSWLNVMLKDSKQTQETKNSTLFVYQGGAPLDSDIIYDNNGTKIFLPGGKAAIGGIIIERNMSNDIITNPIGVFFNQDKQYRIPLRYAFDSRLIDFGSGLNAGIFLMDNLVEQQQGGYIDRKGAVIYLSSKTVKAALTRLFMYKENNPYFKLVHSEDDFYVAYLKSNNLTTDDFVFAGGVRGPIRIWEINYPSTVKANPEYLKTDYPNINLTKAR